MVRAACSIVWGCVLFVLVVAIGKSLHHYDHELISPFSSACHGSTCSRPADAASVLDAPGWLWLSALTLWIGLMLALFRRSRDK